MEAEPEVEAVGAELKPGERRVISDGTDGPIVEIIRRTSQETSRDNGIEDENEMYEENEEEIAGE